MEVTHNAHEDMIFSPVTSGGDAAFKALDKEENTQSSIDTEQSEVPARERSCHSGLSPSPLVRGDPCVVEQKLSPAFATRNQDSDEEFVCPDNLPIDQFFCGDYVRLVGLGTAAMNGRIGTVKSDLLQNGRFADQLHGDENQKAIKMTNLDK